jgi:hypothetical protein
MDDVKEAHLRAEYRAKESAYLALVAGQAEWAARWNAAVACAMAARALADYWEATGDEWDKRAVQGATQEEE